MNFIPQKLKNIFKRSSKKKPMSPAPAARTEAQTVPLEEKKSVIISAPPKPFRKPEALNRYKQEEGYYQLGMDIRFVSDLKEGIHAGRKLTMINSPEIDMYLALINTAPLTSTKILAHSISQTVEKVFGIKNSTVYFHDLKNGAYLDAQDDFTGLPPTGSQYQIILIPENCAWRPITSTPRKSPKGTSPLLRPPGQ